MKKVLLRGPSLTQSGYGVHTRQVAKWLLSRKDFDVKFQALPWGDTPWILDLDADGGLIEKIMKNTVDISSSPTEKYDITFQLQLPNEWDATLGKVNIGLTAAVETDSCNPQWIDACNAMSAVLVPSEHAKKVLTQPGRNTTPIHVVPEAYTPSIDGTTKNSKLPEFGTSFNFLLFGQITGDNPLNDRKNTFFALKWLCEAFKDDKDVGIIVKTNTGRNTHLDKRRTKELVKAVARECRKSDFPKIHLLHGDMTDDEVSDLYVHPQVKALVALTRGEGYGLPILEAAASGLPVVTTEWSGHMDFMKHGKFVGVSYDLKPIHSSRVDGKIFMPGSRWAEPREEDFKKKILKFRSNSSIPKEWATELSTTLRQKYSLEMVFSNYEEALKEFL